MKNISELKPVAAQPRTGATPRRPQPARRRNESSGFPRSQARNEQGAERNQSAERNYERYLLLARAEALTGDRIAAENYFQHAEHYLRLISKNRIKGQS